MKYSDRKFSIPNTRTTRRVRRYSAKNFPTVVLLPTYSPSIETYNLITNIRKYNKDIRIIVIDDHTPINRQTISVLYKIRWLANKDNQITYLRTPQNALKAGALNYGLEYMLKEYKDTKIVFTLDDDVVIEPNTLSVLKDTLYRNINAGSATCLVGVINKDKNIITRLQSLEYNSFNFTKIADNTLLSGPLVIQGMMTAFRTSVLKKVGGFTPKHLIEDYDITVRIKKAGYRVVVSPHTIAWTYVPEEFSKLWKQRVRWTYGGLRVVRENIKNILPIFQDITGHTLFIILFFLILMSFIFKQDNTRDPMFSAILISLALVQLTLSMIYNLIVLSNYRHKDLYDYVLKLSLIPEFIYSNFLTVILLGSYIFLIYQKLSVLISSRFKKIYKLYQSGYLIFEKLGYSSTWGTKN